MQFYRDPIWEEIPREREVAHLVALGKTRGTLTLSSSGSSRCRLGGLGLGGCRLRVSSRARGSSTGADPRHLPQSRFCLGHILLPGHELLGPVCSEGLHATERHCCPFPGLSESRAQGTSGLGTGANATSPVMALPPQKPGTRPGYGRGTNNFPWVLKGAVSRKCPESRPGAPGWPSGEPGFPSGRARLHLSD